MVKVWKDLSDMPSSHLPNELKEYKELMESVPKFDDRSQDNKRKKKKKKLSR